MARWESHATTKANVCVRTTLTEKRAPNAKKDSTIIRVVRNVIVIRLVSLLSLPVAVPFLLESCVSARNE